MPGVAAMDTTVVVSTVEEINLETNTFKLKGPDGVVTEYGQEVKACALGQASCSIMARHIIGSRPEELCEIRDQVFAMLKEGGEPPQGKWADIAALQPVKDFKARHTSTMLVFEAVCDVIKAINPNENRKTGSP